MRDLDRGRLDVVDACRIRRQPSGACDQFVQFRAPALAPLFVAEQSHGEDHGLAAIGLPFDQFARRHARIVDAVGDDEQHLAVARAVLVEIALRELDRVAHGRAADGVGAADARLEHAHVARQRHVDARLVVEVDHEHLVVRIRRARERERGGLDLPAKGAHAAAVVDEHAERHGDVVAPENLDRLTFAVFVHRERITIEGRDDLAAAVSHRRMNDDKARACPEMRRLAGWARRRGGHGHHKCRDREGENRRLHGAGDGPGASRT